MTQSPPRLSRTLSLVGLAATGICSMIGAGINVIPFMIQRNVPGIGPYVIPAFLFAAIPALLAAAAYATLASAMPRAGGSYIYASRALNPYLGFVASFSQWFGLSLGISVVAYVIVPFFRDIAQALGWLELARTLDTGTVRIILSLSFLWIFTGVNMLGIRSYERTLVPLMFLMFLLGGIVIVAGYSFTQADFTAALQAAGEQTVPASTQASFSLQRFLAASALLFASFIGFDSIAQAGGEARNPARTLPLAIGIAVVTVSTFYILFTGAIYHAVPWTYIAEKAQTTDLTAPGLLGYLLPAGLTVAIVAGAAVSLINDLPAMLLAVSRLMFAWAEDGIFPARVARIHPKRHTPQTAIMLSGLMSSLGLLICHLARDFFVGIDILVTSMLINFLLMSLSVLTLPRRNPELAARVTVFADRRLQVVLGGTGAVMISGFLAIHTINDLGKNLDAWYFYSTPVWLLVMALASLIYGLEYRKLLRRGVDLRTRFSTLPSE
ncbi:APC family permease [bacterium]|nr:APC family permease [bacterium]